MTCPPQSDSQNLPVGWRFHPSDEELVDYYLKRKRLGHPIYGLDISEIQVCDYDPRDLPGLSMNNSRDKVWYFFCLRLYHNNRGQAKRKAKDGYWKGTGDLRSVTPEDSDEEIGTKRTLVFHNPKATQWVIHEYEYTAALNLPTKELDLNETPTAQKKRLVSRLEALAKTVGFARRFFPMCSEVLDKFMEDDLPDLFCLERGSPEEQSLRKRGFLELKEDLMKAFNKDKAEF